MFLTAFLLSLVLYAGFYGLDRHLRLRNGPWRITFVTEADGRPAIVIAQPRQHIEHFKIIFAGESVSGLSGPVVVDFDSPLKTPPFGRLVFHDLMYQPGNVTFDFFGHEVQLLPRILTVDRRQIPWTPTATLELPRTISPVATPAR